VHLRSDQLPLAADMIARVIAMDPEDTVGGSVVAALLEETRLSMQGLPD